MWTWQGKIGAAFTPWTKAYIPQPYGEHLKLNSRHTGGKNSGTCNKGNLRALAASLLWTCCILADSLCNLVKHQWVGSILRNDIFSISVPLAVIIGMPCTLTTDSRQLNPRWDMCFYSAILSVWEIFVANLSLFSALILSTVTTHHSSAVGPEPVSSIPCPEVKQLIRPCLPA